MIFSPRDTPKIQLQHKHTLSLTTENREVSQFRAAEALIKLQEVIKPHSPNRLFYFAPQIFGLCLPTEKPFSQYPEIVCNLIFVLYYLFFNIGIYLKNTAYVGIFRAE